MYVSGYCKKTSKKVLLLTNVCWNTLLEYVVLGLCFFIYYEKTPRLHDPPDGDRPRSQKWTKAGPLSSFWPRLPQSWTSRIIFSGNFGAWKNISSSWSRPAGISHPKEGKTYQFWLWCWTDITLRGQRVVLYVKENKSWITVGCTRMRQVFNLEVIYQCNYYNL